MCSSDLRERERERGTGRWVKWVGPEVLRRNERGEKGKKGKRKTISRWKIEIQNTKYNSG